MADKIDLLEQAKAEKRAKAQARKTLKSEADLNMIATAKTTQSKPKSSKSKASSNGKVAVA